MRDRVDDMLGDLISDDTKKKIEEKKDEVSDMANRSIAKFRSKTNGDSGQMEHKEGSNGDHARQKDAKKADTNKEENKSKDRDFEPQSKGKEENKHQPEENEQLDTEKAQELADKLGAKPVAPEDENLSAFHPPVDDELKSA